ncbi:hypothetical protein J4418_04510 [Candidatus Woesearchaeota archaeon]|nr:hypothetical protein [Candidatus Woesearchaeota archaeon]
MSEKKGIMETDVDSLMSLLQNRKNISINDAAKELGVSPGVVEEWAHYFEEVGFIKLSYQFTTPFIQWVGNQEIVSKGVLPPKLKKTLRDEGILNEPEHENLLAKAKSLLSLNDLDEERGITKPKDVANLMNLAHDSVVKGEFEKAKKTYEQLYDAFNKVPEMFLEKMGQIEDDLIKLNNEIIVTLENKVQEEMVNKQSEILKLLKEAYTYLRSGEIDKSIIIYSSIKAIYKQLPPGFFEEKIILTKKVLEFYENLNNLKSKVAKNTLKDKSNLIERQLGIIRLALKKENVDEATMAYSLAREAYSALPEGFFAEKVVLQQKLAEIHQQIVDVKKLYSLTDAESKLKSIRGLLLEIQDLLKNKEIVIAIQRYGEIKSLYSQMPKGFIKNEHIIQNEILKTYKEITNAKNDSALDAIHNGKKKIQSYLEKGKKCVAKTNFDLGFQYYKESIDCYNSLPKGFNKTKVQVRNMIYETYFEIVSHSDMVILGELEGYAKEKYFSLLKLIVNAYEIVSTDRFNLLPDVYKSIYLIYQQLPLALASKKTRLKEEIKNIYLMYKLYLLIETLENASKSNEVSNVQSILSEANGMVENVLTQIPNSAPLINYAKSKLFNFQMNVKKIAPTERLQLPALSDEEFKMDRIDDLMIKAMNYFTIKNHPKAIAYLKEVSKINPNYGPAKAMMEEINLDKKGQGTIRLSKADEKIASAVVKLEEFDYSGAMADAEEALNIEPDNEEAFVIKQKAKQSLNER